MDDIKSCVADIKLCIMDGVSIFCSLREVLAKNRTVLWLFSGCSWVSSVHGPGRDVIHCDILIGTDSTGVNLIDCLQEILPPLAAVSTSSFRLRLPGSICSSGASLVVQGELYKHTKENL